MVAEKVAKARAATVQVAVARAAVETAVGGEAAGGAGPAAKAARRVGLSRYVDRLGQGRLPDPASKRSRRQHHRSGPPVPRSE